MNTIESHQKKLILRGRENFIEWSKRFQALVDIEDWGTMNEGIFTPASPEKGKEAKRWVIMNLSDEAISPIDISKSLKDILDKLNETFGYGNYQPVVQKQAILSLIEFPVSKDPTQVFLWLEKQLDILRLCKGNADKTFLRQVLDTGLQCTMNPTSVNIENSDFWYEMRGKINDLEDTEFDISKVKKALWKFWNSRRNKKIQVDDSKFDPTPKLAKAYNAEQSNKSQRKCEYCDKHRKRLSKSHNTDKCFYGDVPGFERQKSLQVEKDENKDFSNYVALLSGTTIYDTGCTPTSFFRDLPSKFVPTNGWVKTAADQKIPTRGTGEIQIGKLKLNVTHVPEFKYNLLSGIQVMKNGYTQILKNDELKILDSNGQIVAEGKYNPKIGLIQMTESPEAHVGQVSSKLSLEKWHKKFGHFNCSTVQRNLKLRSIIFENKVENCNDCMKSKVTARKDQTSMKMKRDYDLIEMIESDSTPFPIISYDGFSINIKFVDRKSGYIYTKFIANLKSATVLEVFKSFKAKVENVTGKKIKYIRTDGGTEYKNVFLDYLISSGIIKQTAIKKHLPSRAERAHRTILELARSCHSASNLPLKFYSDAHRYATYTANRVIRDTDSKSPFEHMYGFSADPTKLHVFGSVCWVFIPKSKRSDGKLENSGVKCRFLGYGDDESLDESKHGFKLLREVDRKVIYSADVYFKEDEPMIELDPAEKIEYDAFYESLEIAEINPHIDIDDDNESNDEGDFLQKESSSNFRTTPLNNSDQPIEKAIENGHIVTSRGSGNPEMSIENIVNLARECNLTIANVNDPDFLKCFNAAMQMDCPETYEQAMSCSDSHHWQKAMEKEMKSIKDADTWEIIKPTNMVKKPVKCRWVYSKKFDKFGNVSKYKARLVAKGYTQQYGIDYTETFSPVLKLKSLRLLIAIAASLNSNIFQDDVPTAFLKGNIKETIYMEQPKGFQVGSKNDICLLNKTLYGLKQSPREWNNVLDGYLKEQGFTQSKSDTCIYFKRQASNDCIQYDNLQEESSKPVVLVGVFVDDIVTTGDNESCEMFRKGLRKYFGITEGGPLEWYLGISIFKEKDKIVLDQSVYIQQKLDEFKEYIPSGGRSSPLPDNYQKILENWEKDSTIITDFPFRKIVGSLMYVMLVTRFDLACGISVISQFLEKPKAVHIQLVQHMLQYLRANSKLGLIYRSSEILLKGYVDASYASDVGYKSRSGYCFQLGQNMISWFSKRQSVVAQSAAEAEYYAAVSAANEGIWLKQLLNDIGFPQQTIELLEDNEACIALTKNPEDHKRTKHIQVKFHVIRDYVANNQIKFTYCPTKEQLADMFTKGVSGPRLRYMMNNLGLQGLKSQGEN